MEQFVHLMNEIMANTKIRPQIYTENFNNKSPIKYFNK